MSRRWMIFTLAIAAGFAACGCREDPETPTTTESAYRVNWPQTRGGELYKHYCAACHGDRGRGDGYNSGAMSTKPRDLTDAAHMAALSDDRLRGVLRDGGLAANLGPLMPAFGATLKPEELQYLIAHLRTLYRPEEKSGPPQNPADSTETKGQ